MADHERERLTSEPADLDLDNIVHNAVAAVSADGGSELSLRMRLGLFLAAIIVVANSVVGIYNSIALKEEVNCNHQLNSALNVVSDQNRTITKNVIDSVLTGRRLTEAQLVAIKNNYDAQFKVNTDKREALLRTTCNNGESPSPSPS